jgi:uncharacterized protein YneF (UPF0154 family)
MTLFEGMNVWVGIVVFVFYFFFDGLYVLYFKSVEKNLPARAATIGSIMYAINAYGVVSYSHDWRYVFFLIAGAWLGTYITVKWTKNRETKKPVTETKCQEFSTFID